MSDGNGHFYEFGSFRLDVGERQLLNGAVPVPLTPKAFDVLAALVERSGHLIEKDELLNLVWGDAFVEEINVARTVHTLRKLLGEDGKDNKFIETVARKGYRFVAEVRMVKSARRGPLPLVAAVEDAEQLTTGIETEPQVPKPHPEPSPSRAKLSYFAGVLLLLTGIAVFGGWYLRGDRNSSEAPNQGRSPAYDLYMRGKVKVASENRADTEAAIKILEEAVAIDPNFAEAFAQLARGYNTMAFKYSSDPDRKQYNENAEVAIDKALAINPNLAEAHFARGLILWTNSKRFPHEMAIQSYKRSLALDPNLDETHHQLSLVYSHIGLLDEAFFSVNKALEINPNNTLARFRAGVYIAYGGKFDEAIAVYKTIPADFTPLIVDRSMAEALIQIGRLGEAELIVDEYLRKYPQDEGGSFTGVKALLLAKTGKPADAEEAIARSIRIGSGFGHFHHTAYNIACAYATLNMPEEAVKWLENAAENGFPNYSYFEVDPNLNNIRHNDRFQNFMTKLRAQFERFKHLTAGEEG